MENLNPPAIEKLGVTTELYRNYSQAMMQNNYELALRLARQLDAEIFTAYERSFAATFFSIQPKFTFYTVVYAAESRMKNHDYEGAYALYEECCALYKCVDPASFYGPMNNEMCGLVQGKTGEIHFILKGQIDDHFTSLEQLQLDPTPDNIIKMKKILVEISRILSKVRFEHGTERFRPIKQNYLEEYYAWLDKVTAIIRENSLVANDTKLFRPNNLVFSQNTKSDAQASEVVESSQSSVGHKIPK